MQAITAANGGRRQEIVCHRAPRAQKESIIKNYTYDCKRIFLIIMFPVRSIRFDSSRNLKGFPLFS
jgi:hypothetical protein